MSMADPSKFIDLEIEARKMLRAHGLIDEGENVYSSLCLRGMGGIRLEYTGWGSRLVTTREAVERFRQAVAQETERQHEKRERDSA